MSSINITHIVEALINSSETRIEKMILFFLILIASTSTVLATVAQPTPDLTHTESNACKSLVSLLYDLFYEFLSSAWIG